MVESPRRKSQISLATAKLTMIFNGIFLVKAPKNKSYQILGISFADNIAAVNSNMER
jgi:hypothetical protein